MITKLTSTTPCEAKVFEVGEFTITAVGFDGGRLDALHVAEARNGKLIPVGTVKFGLHQAKGLRDRLDALRSGPGRNGFALVRPELVAQVKFFGRYRRGWIRDGVLLRIKGVDHA